MNDGRSCIMEDQSQAKKIINITLPLAVGFGAYLALAHFFSGENKNLDVENKSIIKDSKAEPEIDLAGLLSDVEEASPSADEIAESMGMTMEFDDSAKLVDQVMNQMSKVNSERGMRELAKVLGNGDIDNKQLTELKRLFIENRVQPRDENAIELLGELKAGKVSRWNLHLNDDSKIQLQTTRQKDGTWRVDEVKFPLSNIDENGNAMTKGEIIERDKLIESRDPLIFSSNFIKELVVQNFEKARMLVNNETISDAKIAGLCILFEDGAYSLNEKKPLQAVRITDEVSAFYVNVDAKEGGNAQFSLTVLRENVKSPWLIHEINLDRLLDDYANRIAGGDVYYTPLVKKPSGGDILVIYFDFDSDGLTDRTKKQLDVVVNLIKLDASKKVRLSGHTDGKGSDEYNQGLSKGRALIVKEYLTQSGINPEQIITEAHGFSKPIRNENEEDDANARRANRRTEVYLDF